MFEQTFCSSPWIHMRIKPSGEFGPCRWANHRDNQYNIRTHSISEYFQTTLSSVRYNLLAGKDLDMCVPCYDMEHHGKISGRQRQLIKVGIRTDRFLPTLNNSTFLEKFKESWQNNGNTDLYPVDWQIDLGNYCNAACVMCNPRYSSRIAQEFKKIGIINNSNEYNVSWSQDKTLVDKFCEELTSGPAPAYLHFIGGETVIMPAFKTILEKLLLAGMRDTAIGFTTNLTVWPQTVANLLKQFKQVNIGLSIEALHEINHYVRWPSDQSTVLDNLKKWIIFGKSHNHLIQLRLTPNALTVLHIADLYQYAWDNKIGLETCNFLYEPRCLSLKVLPKYIREMAIHRLENFISDKSFDDQIVVNTRNPHTINQQVLQDAVSYINFLKETPEDTDGAKQLVKYITQLERSRGNCILEYLPEYEKFLRSNDYQT